MTTMMASPQTSVTGGIDTHKDTHYAVVLDHAGGRIADKQFPVSAAGYRQLLDWMCGFGVIDRVGIESTGSYAAGLTRFLHAAGVDVVEVNRPHRYVRAHRGKDDAIDAEAAARKVLSGEATTRPEDTTGVVEAIRVLAVARSSAVNGRAKLMVQIRDVLITAPAPLREQITAVSSRGKVTQCLRLRPDRTRIADPVQASKMALRSLARRVIDLEAEIGELDIQLAELVTATAPTLISRVGIGIQHAAQLLVTAGQNIDRLTSEAAFARLCGVAPIPVSSGKTHRMRLHRGGDRQANRALHMIAVCRLRYDQRTIDYMARRRAEGLSKKDVLRCLKRFIAREVFHNLKTDLELP